MKTRYIFFLAAMGLLASCTKEADAPQINEEVTTGGKTYLTVNLDTATKTYLGPGDKDTPHPVYWSKGDMISVNGCDSDPLGAQDAGKASVTFTINGTPSTPYNVLYPFEDWVDGAHISLPAVQDWAEDNIDKNMLPLAGQSAGNSISLHHLCAIVKVSVKQESEGDAHDLTSVRFKGRNGEQVSGLFTIDYAGTAPTNMPSISSASDASADKEVKVVHTYSTSTTEAVDYYLVVPARTYSSGFDVIVKDASGHIMTKSKTSSTELVAGHMYAMDPFEFVPTKTEMNVDVNSAQDLIDFAYAYNNGDYDDPKIPIVTLKNNITFTDSESNEFNAKGGIGTSSKYFHGEFHGGGYTISNPGAKVPLFAYTDNSSQILNLTLSGSLAIDAEDATEYHAAFVGRNKGLIEGCTSSVSIIINNIGKVTTTSQHYGGLVGRNYGGTIKNCTVTGNITCSQSDVTITANSAYIGGIVGTNAEAGAIKNNSVFSGNITISDGTTYGGITAIGKDGDKDVSLYFYVGGIVGYADNGEISNCTTGIDGTPKSIDVRGTFVPAVGGILGWSRNAADSEISYCNNYASLSVASNGARGVTTPLRIGGIASRSAADINDCNNYGAISSVSNSTTIYIGGIVGDGANVSDCINYAGGAITRSNAGASAGQTNRYIYMGGIMGGTNAACDVTRCKNYATVTSNNIGTSTSTTVDMGGIVGCGGASSPSQIDIESCENNGAVTLVNNGTVLTTRLAIGGILGYGSAANSTIKSCDNKAQIYCNSQQNKAERVSYSGGIAGLMGTMAAGVAGLEIGNCTNSARVWNRNYNTTVTPASSTPFGGGIVGAIIGTSASKASVHDCTTSDGDVVELRGYCGGIAGYTQYATIKDNTVGQALTGSNANSQGVGGIVGWAVNTSLSGCSTSGSINAVKYIGGLVAYLGTGSSISSCNVNNPTLTTGTNDAATAAAVLVSNAASGTTITGCGVKGTLNGEEITLESNMITTGAAGATVTGTYLLP